MLRIVVIAFAVYPSWGLILPRIARLMALAPLRVFD